VARRCQVDDGTYNHNRSGLCSNLLEQRSMAQAAKQR